MDTQFVRDRITQLRLKKGVSEYAKSELDNSVAALKGDQREALAAFIKTIV